MDNEKTATPDKEVTAPGSVPASTIEGTGPVPRFLWERTLRASPDIKPSKELATLLIIATFLDLDGTGYLSLEKLAASLNVNERTARRHRDEMIRRGWLACTKRGGRAPHGSRGRGLANEYALTVPASSVDNEMPNDQDAGSVDSMMSDDAAISGQNGIDQWTKPPASVDSMMSNPSPVSQAKAPRPKAKRDSRADDASARSADAAHADAGKNRAVELVVEKCACTRDDAETWITEIIERHKPDNIHAYVRSILAKGQRPPKPEQTKSSSFTVSADSWENQS